MRGDKVWRVVMRCYACHQEQVVTLPDDTRLWSVYRYTKCHCGGERTATAAKLVPVLRDINDDRVGV